MRELDDVDKEIIQVARTLFLQQGIHRTEMKDIAKHTGIGRSTLYRHFQSKDLIAFHIAKEIIVELNEGAIKEQIMKADSGYERFYLQLRANMEAMLNNPDKVRFLDEFDQIFTDGYPQSEEAEDYVEFNRSYQAPIIRYYSEGIEDGSIKACEDKHFQIEVIMSILLGMAQRIIPREQHYIQEHSHGGREYLEEMLRLVLSSIRV
ncbi:MAG TPA: helix-turn-helix domain-containing protein [Lachnospiraceae bacterium]|nr:helix-turn-helix domain-containing protein [Lachnospiraceae bacterium]